MKSASRHINHLYFIELIQALGLILLGFVGLLYPPRPLFTWFPSLTIVSASVFAISTLMSLDKGIRLRSRSSLLVYIISRTAIIFMMVLSVCLLVAGFHSGHTTHRFTVPLAAMCVVHCIWGFYAILEALLFRATLPFKRGLSFTGSEKLGQVEQLKVISCKNIFDGSQSRCLSGSVQTVFTTASEL